MKRPKWTKQVSPPTWGRVALAFVPLLLLGTFFVLAGDEFAPLYVMFLVPMVVLMAGLCVYFPGVHFSEVLPWLGALTYFFGRMFWDSTISNMGWAVIGVVLSLAGFLWTLLDKVPLATVTVVKEEEEE